MLMPAASIITTCKGRLVHLKQSLGPMLSQQCDFPYEVLVVDYGDPDRAFTWCATTPHRRLRCVRVLDDARWFNASRARNCGAACARGTILAFVDADVLVAPNWLAQVARPLMEDDYVLNTCTVRACAGILAVATNVFHAARGFDEAMLGWGAEDRDFRNRCLAQGLGTTFPGELLSILRHSDELCVRFYWQKDKRQSRRQNRCIARRRSGPVNPNGYGRAKLERWPAGELDARCEKKTWPDSWC